MAAPTYIEILDATKTALLEIALTGQSVSGDGRTLTQANIGDLKSLVEWCESRIARESRGGAVRFVAVIARA